MNRLLNIGLWILAIVSGLTIIVPYETMSYGSYIQYILVVGYWISIPSICVGFFISIKPRLRNYNS